MNEKFTKGPWSVDIGCSQAFITKENLFIHEGNVDFNTGNRDERVANAHLIAAAPEMYEMIDSLSRELLFMIRKENSRIIQEVNCASENPPDYIDEESVYLAQKLLAKARGEL